MSFAMPLRLVLPLVHKFLNKQNYETVIDPCTYHYQPEFMLVHQKHHFHKKEL